MVLRRRVELARLIRQVELLPDCHQRALIPRNGLPHNDGAYFVEAFPRNGHQSDYLVGFSSSDK
jgi:hypothetical protein